MVVNALLQSRRVTVNDVDVTTALNGAQWLSLDRPKISENGLFPASGTLTLLPVQGYADNFFNPRKNRAQWLQGNSVVIEVNLGSGLQRLFTGYLLQRPATPTDSAAALSLTIGDELVLRDVDTPAGDRAGVKLGNLTTRTNIIKNIVSGGDSGSAWNGSWTGQISEFPIAYPCPKHQGSYVAQMGAIAASAGYGLYCDRQGNLTAAKFSLAPAALLVRTYANLPSLVPADGSDKPAPKVQATVSGRSVAVSSESDSFVVTEQGIVAITWPSSDFGAPATIQRGIKKRTTFTEEWSPNFKRHVERTKVELPLIDKTVSPANILLTLQEIVEVVSVYSADRTGKLQTRQTNTYEGPLYAGQAGRIALQENPWTQSVLSLRSVESWTYDGEMPTSRRTENYGLSVDSVLAVQARSVNYFVEEELLSTDVVEWTQLAGDRWRKTESRFLPSREVGQENVQLEGNTTISVGAQYRPSEPERHIPTDTTEEVDYIALAEFAGVASEETEVPIFEFEYGVSDQQAKALSELHGAILIGRDTGWQCQLELTAEWLDWTPAGAAQLTLPDGTISLFLIEGVNIALSENYGFVTFSCVDLGSLGTELYQRPVGQVLDGAIAAQSSIVETTSLLPPYIPVSSIRAGGRLGARISADPSVGPPTLIGRTGGRLGASADTPVGIDGGGSGGRLGTKTALL